MALSRRHGFTFHLYYDPEGDLWFEVHRDRDDAVVEFSKVPDAGLTTEEVVDHWITNQLEDQFSDITLRKCRACGRACQEPRYIDNEMDPRDEIAWRFDLCPTCADRLRSQHPWLELDRNDDEESEYGRFDDW